MEEVELRKEILSSGSQRGRLAGMVTRQVEEGGEAPAAAATAGSDESGVAPADDEY